MILFLSISLGMSLVTLGVMFRKYRKFRREILALIKVTRQLSYGELNVEIFYDFRRKDPAGELQKNMVIIRDKLRQVLKELDNASRLHARGFIYEVTDINFQRGAYKEVSENANVMLKDYANVVEDVTRVLHALSEGDLNVQLNDYPGQKSTLTTGVIDLLENIHALNADISHIITAVAEGNLNKRITESRTKGDFKRLVDGINGILDHFANPISEMGHVLEAISAGDLSRKITSVYHGDFKDMVTNINHTTQTLQGYIEDMSHVLGKMANNDFRVAITRDYQGDFSTIKSSISDIIANFNHIVTRIIDVSETVGSATSEISNGMDQVSQNASVQESTIKILNEKIISVDTEAAKNSASAQQAHSTSAQLEVTAAQGMTEMQSLLNAMKDIDNFSNQTLSVIKVIEDIAFQTNLLALNASVEAARAGEHGRGFAVVAEEVRGLAGRSAEAAKDTAALISQSTTSVKLGYTISEKMSQTLEEIVTNISEITEKTSQISQGSELQTQYIAEVALDTKEVASITEENSRSSEELAAAANELLGQTESLQELVNIFETV